jgi:MFS family permease
VSRRTQWILFIVAVVSMSAATGLHDSLFNNFLSDEFGLSAQERGWLEFPRELPGFLAAAMAAALYTLAVTRMATVGALGFALGAAGLALIGGSFVPMVAMMVLASAGLHLLMPVGQSIVLGLSDEHNRGRRMGMAGAFGTAGVVLGTGSVWLLFDRVSPQYALGFLITAGLACVAGFVYAMMHLPHMLQPRPRMIVRRKYWLYYALETLHGARKQIFLTFGPWVLIRVYGVPATSMAKLLMIAAIIGVFFQPVMGHVLDRLGERRIMILDGLLLSVVCIGYGYSITFMGSAKAALPLACACYVADNLLFALGAARAIYLSRLTESSEELTSTLTLGVSINHIASMTIPAVAGAIWVGFGYETVFIAAAMLALCTAALALRVPRHGQMPAPVLVSEPERV